MKLLFFKHICKQSDTYPTTKCIIDCTELFCQRPSSLAIQSSLFSHYKHHVTYKGLVGIAPSGAITFVGELFDGSISDAEIVKRSGILQKEFWEDGDSVMADRGFTIADLLSPMGVSLDSFASQSRFDAYAELMRGLCNMSSFVET